MRLRDTATRSLQAAHENPSDEQEEKKKEGRLNKSVREINTLFGVKIYVYTKSFVRLSHSSWGWD